MPHESLSIERNCTGFYCWGIIAGNENWWLANLILFLFTHWNRFAPNMSIFISFILVPVDIAVICVSLMNMQNWHHKNKCFGFLKIAIILEVLNYFGFFMLTLAAIAYTLYELNPRSEGSLTPSSMRALSVFQRSLGRSGHWALCLHCWCCSGLWLQDLRSLLWQQPGGWHWKKGMRWG